MYLQTTGECDVYSTLEGVEVNEEFFSDQLKDKTFDSQDDLDKFIEKIEAEYDVVFDTLCYQEVTTEEEDEEEWNNTISAAMAESEATGQPFDHIMGEILGGVR